MLYYDNDSIEYETAEKLAPRSEQLIRQFRLYQLAEAERSLARSKNQAQTSFGALLKLRAKEELLDSLHPSCATLLVVPNTLTQHWEVSRCYLWVSLCLSLCLCLCLFILSSCSFSSMVGLT